MTKIVVPWRKKQLFWFSLFQREWHKNWISIHLPIESDRIVSKWTPQFVSGFFAFWFPNADDSQNELH